MKGDFSKDTFDPGRHFTRVLMQQGRVHLDADFNEQAAIATYLRRTLARDLIGPEGGPLDNAGFAIVGDAAGAKALGKVLAPGDFVIGTGRYYVDGQLCENSVPLLYSEQQGYPFDPDTTIDALAEAANRSGFTIYLDVWERHVAVVEQPALAEVALGGPDTASRAQLTWQVRVLLPENANRAPVTLNDALGRNLPRLAARAEPPAASSDPCTVDPAARYRGLENQLYRVEIHAPGAADPERAGASYKWSRDNGAIVFPLAGAPVIDAVGSSTTVSLTTLGHDDAHGLEAHTWVELVDDLVTLRGAAGSLLRVHSVDRDSFSVVLEGQADPGIGVDPRLHPYLRRWDHSGDPAAGGAVPVVESAEEPLVWRGLEDGVQVIFPGAVDGNAATYRTGDYWLIPARTATGSVEWPRLGEEAGLNPQPLPPKGIEHVYASLAAVGPDPAGGRLPVFADSRKFFGPLAV